MRQTALVLLLLAAGSIAVRADEVWLKNLPYRNATVVGVQDGSIVFLWREKRLIKPLEDVTRIRLASNEPFNKAEALFSAGKYAEAARAYADCLAGAKADWQKKLIDRRGLLARKFAHEPPAKKDATTAPAARCWYCGGTGRMPCPDCRWGSRSTGRARCAQCKGTGRVTCPQCQGNWRKNKCARCNGKGTIVRRLLTPGGVARISYGRCSACSGRGWLFICPTCGGKRRRLRGTVRCTKCEGTGFAGDCPTCKGTKRVPCAHCPAGKRESAKRPTTTQVKPKPPVPTLTASPEEIFKGMPEPPDYSELTPLWAQRERAKYRALLKEWQDGLIGSQVKWTVEVLDVSPDAASEKVVLRAAAGPNTAVRAALPAGDLSKPGKLKKDQTVEVAGRIASMSIRAAAGAASGRAFLTFVLEAVSVRTDGGEATSSGLSEDAHHVVFLVDQSGSMLDLFDTVRRELAESVDQLRAPQTFHVIFFGDKSLKENPPRRLVQATEDNKQAAVKFLRGIQPQGTSDPMPGLKRAFAVLGAAPRPRTGKLICLLTDGEFASGRKILELIRRMNADKGVRIDTVLYNYEHQAAIKILSQIAKENGGRFRHHKP